MTEQQKPATPVPAPATAPTTKPGTPAGFQASKAPATQQATSPAAPTQTEPVRVEIVAPQGPVTTPETAAPDGSNPSQYPADGTKLEGLMAPSFNTPIPADTVSSAVLDGNPPPYDAEAKHGLVEEPSETAGRLPLHCKIADLGEGDTVYKLGVSHPPYKVESVGKGFAVLRAGTGGTVQITNDSEASFYTKDQNRQYAVADGNPNVSGDVKHP